MHKSRLGGIIIDCQTEDLEGAADFWSRALGMPKLTETDPVEQNYVTFGRRPDDLDVEVQKVTHASRVHIDIETDDIEAECKRLEALGAKRIEAIRSWVVMEAPTGHRFCLVPVQRSNFEEDANQWD